jgi:pimeloyl-ACP methyl ester carboxylesterase
LHGRDIAYDDRGSGAPFVFIHGIGSSAVAWQPVTQVLVQHGFRTVAVDLPGHGASHREPGDYSLSELASVQRDLLDHLGIDRCILVGHSLGGGIALQFAYIYPDRLSGLALVAAGGLGVDTSRVLKVMALPGSGVVIAAGFNRVTVGAAEWVARHWPGRRPLPAVLGRPSLDRFWEFADPGHRDAFLAILRSVVDSGGQKVSALPHFEAIEDLPVLIVWGGRDHVLPVAHGERAHELLPASSFQVFPDAGHEPHLDEPAAVAALLEGLAVRCGADTAD